MRISASWFGSTVLLGPPHGRTWQRSATGSGLRLVSCSFRRVIAQAVVRGSKGGCDRPVLARLIMLLRSRYRAVPRSAKHPGRPRRAERRTEFAVSLGSLPGWIAGSLYLLHHHAAERPKERRCLLQNLFLTSKSPWKVMRRVPHTFKKRAPALDQIEVQNFDF